MTVVSLCDSPVCRKVAGHLGDHDPRPKEAWGFLLEIDKNKIGKVGYATPRGGAKGAYQNHVYRNNRVIVPFERLTIVDLAAFKDGYVVRFLPEQYFESPGIPRPELLQDGVPQVGFNAFVLYRSHEALASWPPPSDWNVRSLSVDGTSAVRRSARVIDDGQYVLRLSNAGNSRGRDSSGPPQGIFAPEYADAETNYLAQTMLAWLVVHSRSSPYTTTQADHLHSILSAEGLAEAARLELRGVTRNGLSICPLCLRVIDYRELHEQVDFEGVSGLSNAAAQVIGATRSTKANLFHLEPLVYERLNHNAKSVAWGHAHCNTLLGQRHCYSLSELRAMDLKLGVIVDDDIRTIGWISEDFQMIRSPGGAVWVQLTGDMPADELNAAFSEGSAQ